jgi:MOSC domain-containing protein YiiM
MKKNALKIGTLIRDNEKLGIITKVIEVGQLNAKVPIIAWRANYEITYTDGTTLLVSCKALDTMIANDVVEVYPPATLPPEVSYPATSHGGGKDES